MRRARVRVTSAWTGHPTAPRRGRDRTWPPHCRRSARPPGATGEFSTDLKRCDIAVTGNCLSEVAATLESFVTLRLMGLTLTEVGDLNDLIDGPDESSKESAGMFRWASSTSPSPAHYFMIPFAP